MFAKISALFLFVFCLFSLGQAAPILDDSDISSLSTRGLFQHLFHKADPVTQKKIDAVSVEVECMMHSIHLKAQEAFIAAAHTLTEEKDKLVVKDSKSSDFIVKEYQTRIKDLTKSAKKAGSQVKDRKSALKKLGVEESHCKSVAADSSSTSNSHST